ncbi:hypothetical protein RND71_044141 [Anisodus tanguticus]|uniref:Cytosol aminopeptidase domain-containing protein n=1 Tax=Anisodus tanguticus TaxID=243964 RepID=A0AAE1QQC0_9SOLA|nr:hypothetical protein RND71_044141 [Anisodus tanguticus]
MNALILGLFDNDDEKKLENVPTPFFTQIDSKLQGKLSEELKLLGPLKASKSRVFFKLSSEYPVIVVVGLGSIKADFNEIEELQEKKENIRKAIAVAVNSIRSLDGEFKEIHFDSCQDAESVVEGAVLSDWRFDELKNEKSRRKPIEFLLADISDSKEVAKWKKGFILSRMQNFCRKLQELPANIMTPTRFGQEAKELCEPLGVKVLVHDRQWAEEKKMYSFLSVANGSDEPCKFVELHYMNAGEKRPLVFVGKGITFDTGGISIKPSSGMDLMRADQSGGCIVLTTIASLAKLKAEVNIIGLIPLTENTINGKATKPGDVVVAMNGKSIQIDNTDAEGRLVLADALCYGDTFDPFCMIDIATLTGAIKQALGQACTAVYSTNSKHWEMIRESGYETGDRVWRMPLFKNYSKLVKDPALADLINMSNEPSYGAGSCIGAVFLKEFAKCENWMHLDMAGTKYNTSDVSYISRGMSGRPLRTMVKFIEKLFM